MQMAELGAKVDDQKEEIKLLRIQVTLMCIYHSYKRHKLLLYSFGVCDQCEKLTEQNAALMRQLLTMESEAIDAEQATTTAKSGSADAAVKVCRIHTHQHICILTIDTLGKGFYNTFAGSKRKRITWK